MLFEEPTAALTGDEVEFLKSLIAKTRERAAIIYVSYRLSEVLELSDRLYVLKDDFVVASMPTADVTEGKLHERMVGRTRQEFFYREHLREAPRSRSLRWTFDDLSGGRLFQERQLLFALGRNSRNRRPFGVRKVRSCRALAGDSPALAGRIAVSEREIHSPSIAAMNEAGAGYLPPDRREASFRFCLSRRI